MKNRVIKVDELARVEGEGGLQIRIQDGKVADVKLRIPEPPRFFEALLRGRNYAEAPDITARICGICPVAYQMSAVHAIEDAFGITVDGQLRSLRRLMYCGEYIESHILHAAMLHAPDFLGFDDAIAMARDKPGVVRDALSMKRIGNDIVAVVGGREIHPINVRVGGFYRLPSTEELKPLVGRLRWGLDAARTLALAVGEFEFPDFEAEYEFLALHHPEEYALCEGKLRTSSGHELPAREYEFHFEERHVLHSHALHSFEKGHGEYCVGPLARFNLNFPSLPKPARELAEELKLIPPVRNPFKSILVRLVETVFAFDEALRIIEQYEPPPRAAVEVIPRPGIGFAATEAPRGTLYHRYRINDRGSILDAKIVPPTTQNQPTIEHDLRRFVEANIEMPREELTLRCEQAIRNYDPCISCATHAVRVEFV